MEPAGGRAVEVDPALQAFITHHVIPLAVQLERAARATSWQGHKTDQDYDYFSYYNYNFFKDYK